MGTIFFGLVCFIAGALVGAKYPETVNVYVDKTKQKASELKDKLTKKETPPQA
mgnify:CR=1 FL=1